MLRRFSPSAHLTSPGLAWLGPGRRSRRWRCWQASHQQLTYIRWTVRPAGEGPPSCSAAHPQSAVRLDWPPWLDKEDAMVVAVRLPCLSQEP